jgi:hypothetical protein
MTKKKCHVPSKGKYWEEFMAQYKIKDTVILDGTVKFIFIQTEMRN